MSKLIIIRSNSGSGKTSLAKALQRKIGRNTMVISQYTVRRDMLWVYDCIGTDMMERMLDVLTVNGYQQASLAVQKANYAVRMYRKAGFEIIGENEEEYIMVKRLTVSFPIWSERSKH